MLSVEISHIEELQRWHETIMLGSICIAAPEVEGDIILACLRAGAITHGELNVDQLDAIDAVKMRNRIVERAAHQLGFPWGVGDDDKANWDC